MTDVSFEIVERWEAQGEGTVDAFAFDLVSGDHRVEVGRQYDRRDAQHLAAEIAGMGFRVEWVHG